MKQRVLGVARGMVRREVERLEVVVVGLDLGAFADGVAHRLEDGDDLVHHAQHGVLDADRAMDAGKGDVETLGGELGISGRRVNFVVSVFNRRFHASFQFVDAAADLALGRAGRGLQPDVVDLREDAVLASEPAIAEGFAVCVGMQRGGFVIERGEQVGDGAVECVRRVVFEFGNRVHSVRLQRDPERRFSRRGGICCSNAAKRRSP